MNTSPKMKRINLYMAVPQLKELERESRRTGRSISELVRQATEEYLTRKEAA